jgi:hypothetical protein
MTKKTLKHTTFLKDLKTRGVSHCGLAISIKKYLKAKAKEEL